MSYHGKQYKGASKDLRARKHAEAKERAMRNIVINCACGARHSIDRVCPRAKSEGGAA